MKKAIAGIAAALVMLTACGSDGSSEDTVVEETVAESTEMTEAGDIVSEGRGCAHQYHRAW